ncbi:MAG: hypothetical protein OHK0029_06870 [Armatimonadaceae bacterium]
MLFGMKAYSLDLRERILAACDNGATAKEAAERFAVSHDTVQRYKRQRRERGTLAPKPIPGRVPHIKETEHEAYRELVASRSDWTLASLAEAWEEQTGRKPTVSVLSDTCQRLGITHKKRADSRKNEIPKSGSLFEKRYFSRSDRASLPGATCFSG